MKAMQNRQSKLQQFRMPKQKHQDLKKFQQAHSAFSISRHDLKKAAK